MTAKAMRLRKTGTSRQRWPLLLHRVVGTVRRRSLFAPHQHLLVAVSGGPDSVALVSLLHRLASSWKLTLTAVHFNYGLRGRESDDDEAFVVSLCGELSIPLRVRRLSLKRRTAGASVQAVARELRYEALKQIARECGAGRIAVGHTADDQAETVLLWMLRGAGLAGLSGMPPSREGLIVRPLYDASREEILSYLDGTGLRYRQDSSNAKATYLRNRIRHEVMPVLKRITPSSVRALCRLADLCREDEGYLEREIGAMCAAELRGSGESGWWLKRAFLRSLPLALQRRVIREALRRCDPNRRPASAQSVDRILASSAGRGSASADLKSVQLTVTPTQVHLRPVGSKASKSGRRKSLDPMEVAIPSVITWSGTGQQIRVQPLPVKAAVRGAAGRRESIVLDADRFSAPLVVRPWHPGDRFCPVGMKGRSKKVQDLFTDLKVPAGDRSAIPILAAPEGIVWVVGYRQDERFAAQRSTSRRVLVQVMNQPRMEGVS